MLGLNRFFFFLWLLPINFLSLFGAAKIFIVGRSFFVCCFSCTVLDRSSSSFDAWWNRIKADPFLSPQPKSSSSCSNSSVGCFFLVWWCCFVSFGFIGFHRIKHRFCINRINHRFSSVNRLAGSSSSSCRVASSGLHAPCSFSICHGCFTLSVDASCYRSVMLHIIGFASSSCRFFIGFHRITVNFGCFFFRLSALRHASVQLKLCSSLVVDRL